jgi:transposase
MASRFLVPDREQTFLEAVSYRDVLGDDHPVWTVIDVVEGLDLSVVYDRYEADVSVGGRRAFDPAMLLALLVFGYCEGKRSSRQLEEACRRDWAYRAICGEITPDHATIARFRAGLDDVLEPLFAQVLAVCSAAGLVEVGLVALDGTRMGAAASKEANKTASTLERLEAEARVMLDEAAVADNADDGGGGVRVSSQTRRDTERERRAVRIREAQQVVADAVDRQAFEEKKRGRKKRPVANVTDPESRLQKTRAGFIQGYNAQSVVSADQIVVACEVTPEATDTGWLEPMLATAVENVEAAGVTDPIGVAVADAGYWSQANAEAGEALGVDLLIATTKSHQVGTPADEEADDEAKKRDRERLPVIARINDGEIGIADGARQLGLSHSWVSKLVARYRRHGSLMSEATLARHAMEHRLAQPVNRDRYRQGGWLIEGSFAHIKTHRNTSRFSRRGLAACNAEWALINLAGNLLKLHRRPDPTPGSDTEPRSGPPVNAEQDPNTPNLMRCTRPGATTHRIRQPHRHGQKSDTPLRGESRPEGGEGGQAVVAVTL